MKPPSAISKLLVWRKRQYIASRSPAPPRPAGPSTAHAGAAAPVVSSVSWRGQAHIDWCQQAHLLSRMRVHRATRRRPAQAGHRARTTGVQVGRQIERAGQRHPAGWVSRTDHSGAGMARRTEPVMSVPSASPQPRQHGGRRPGRRTTSDAPAAPLMGEPKCVPGRSGKTPVRRSPSRFTKRARRHRCVAASVGAVCLHHPA
jgi:hypothetical protein